MITDDSGNLKQAYQFSPSGSRLMNTDYTTNQTTFYANTGDTTLAEYVEYSYLQPTWTKSYTYFGDTLLSTISNASGAEYIEFNHPDQLGTRTITNQQAGTSYEQKTLPFGTALNAESTVQTNNKRFTSYDRSAITGLDYAINRTYDSKQGRFTQVDPIGMKAADFNNPQTLNLYSYCGNDPINHTDPNGLFWGAIGRFFKKIGNIVTHVAAAVSRILNNRWVRLGFLVLDFILPRVGGLAHSIINIALKIYNTASDLVGMAQLAGMAMQGKFKELAISLVVAAATAPLTAIAAGIKKGLQDAIFTNHHGGYPDLASFFGTAWKGFKQGLHDGWMQFKKGFDRKGLAAFIPFYGNWCGPQYPGDGVDPDLGSLGINDFDENGCRAHDKWMFDNKRHLNGHGGIWDKIKGDFALIGHTFTNGSSVHAIDIGFSGRAGLGASYKFMLVPVFGGRIAVETGQLIGHHLH